MVPQCAEYISAVESYSSFRPQGMQTFLCLKKPQLLSDRPASLNQVENASILSQLPLQLRRRRVTCFPPIRCSHPTLSTGSQYPKKRQNMEIQILPFLKVFVSTPMGPSSVAATGKIERLCPTVRPGHTD